MSETFVGIQIGAISFIDEGVEQVLDILQEKAGVNALMISALSWSIGNAGRAAFGFPDHGVQEPDNLRGGAMFEPDPRYYQKTFMKRFAAPDPLYKGFDTLADVIPAARKRGMSVYTYYCETSSSGIRSIWQPGFEHFVDRDHLGRVATRPSLLESGLQDLVAFGLFRLVEQSRFARRDVGHRTAKPADGYLSRRQLHRL